MKYDLKSMPYTGLLFTLIIIVAWFASLEILLRIDISKLAMIGIVFAILGRTFLQTGLFIVAHDAIHRAILPGDRQLNQQIGQWALTLYALLSYRKLALNHWQHHHCPGHASDPDFHDGTHRNAFAWYLKFMKGYLDIRQIIIQFFGIGIIFFTLNIIFYVPILNLLLFWVVPVILSTIQLFFFGTYLPHRGHSGNQHDIVSSNWPSIVSFLSCYHFGYHREHHEYPYLPWYRLPSIHHNR